MSGGVLNHWPFIRHIFPTMSGYVPLVEAMKPLWKFLKNHIATLDVDQQGDAKNFMQIYSQEILHQSTNGRFFSEDQLLSICVDFFQAGSETTSNTLAFSILYMLHYPDVMKKVQKELQSVVKDRLPKLSDRPNLKYTEATLCEIQRMTNVAPLGKFAEMF
jgi:methyl farnesoate epoxidase/farnesoate epoxidase